MFTITKKNKLICKKKTQKNVYKFEVLVAFQLLNIVHTTSLVRKPHAVKEDKKYSGVLI